MVLQNIRERLNDESTTSSGAILTTSVYSFPLLFYFIALIRDRERKPAACFLCFYLPIPDVAYGLRALPANRRINAWSVLWSAIYG